MALNKARKPLTCGWMGRSSGCFSAASTTALALSQVRGFMPTASETLSRVLAVSLLPCGKLPPGLVRPRPPACPLVSLPVCCLSLALGLSKSSGTRSYGGPGGRSGGTWNRGGNQASVKDAGLSCTIVQDVPSREFHVRQLIRLKDDAGQMDVERAARPPTNFSLMGDSRCRMMEAVIGNLRSPSARSDNGVKFSRKKALTLPVGRSRRGIRQEQQQLHSLSPDLP